MAARQHADQDAQRRCRQRLRRADHHPEQSGHHRHRPREGGARGADRRGAARHPRQGGRRRSRRLRGQCGQGAADSRRHRSERFAREEDGRRRRTRHDGMDAGQRCEGRRETHGFQGRRGAHERRRQRRSVGALRRGVLHGRDDACRELDVGRRQIPGHGAQEAAFGQNGVGAAFGGELRQRHEGCLLAQGHRDDAPTALPQLHAAALRPQRLRQPDQDAPLAAGERPHEPRLPDAGEGDRRDLRPQSPPADDLERDHRQIRLRAAARRLRQTLPRRQRIRLHVRGQHRPRNAETPRGEVHRFDPRRQEAP